MVWLRAPHGLGLGFAGGLLPLRHAGLARTPPALLALCRATSPGLSNAGLGLMEGQQPPREEKRLLSQIS
eukprot:4817670-Alexandrium_andersonii.AAC.1